MQEYEMNEAQPAQLCVKIGQYCDRQIKADRKKRRRKLNKKLKEFQDGLQEIVQTIQTQDWEKELVVGMLEDEIEQLEKIIQTKN